jgi:glycopeptide antibiotics resistance protein
MARQRVAVAGWALAGMTTLWLFWMTLRPNPQVNAQLRPITSKAARHGIPAAFAIGIVGNIAVFVPLGMGLAAALKGRWSTATPVGASVSLVIEGVQHFLPSRASSFSDFVLNTVGVASGAFIIHLTFKIWRHYD